MDFRELSKAIEEEDVREEEDQIGRVWGIGAVEKLEEVNTWSREPNKFFDWSITCIFWDYAYNNTLWCKHDPDELKHLQKFHRIKNYHSFYKIVLLVGQKTWIRIWLYMLAEKSFQR